jgi:hypothetical protein
MIPGKLEYASAKVESPSIVIHKTDNYLMKHEQNIHTKQ